MDGNLTITGTGSLTTTGDDEAGIDVSGNLTVNGGTVIGNHTDDTGIDVHGNLTVNSGGTVSGTSSTQEGVHALHPDSERRQCCPAAVFRAFVSKTALQSKAAPSTGHRHRVKTLFHLWHLCKINRWQLYGKRRQRHRQRHR